MTQEQLIAKQALQIEDLKERLAVLKTASKNVLMMLHCIGGPLNDNKHGYTKEQLKIFFNIEKELE